MMKKIILFSLFLTCTLAKEIEKDEGIYVLTDKNYDEGVKQFQYLLVYFYAPWCGHCKAFGPELVKAGQQLKEKNSPIKFAKVNGPEEEELLKKMHVNGYPTLFFYRDGEPIPYGGGRMASEMVEWVEKKIGPPATVLEKAENVKEFIDNNDVVVVGFFSDPESEAAKQYKEAVRDYEEYPCAITADMEAAKNHDAKDGEIVLFKNFDDRRAVYSGAIGKDALLEFIQRYAVPLVVEFNHETAQKIFRGLVKSHILLFVNYKSDEYETTVKVATKLAEEFRNKVMFVTVDTEEDDHRRIIEFLGLKGEKFPTMRIIQMKDDIDKFKAVEGQHDQHDITNEDNLRKFVQDYLDGKVPQHYLTEDLPEDWNKHPVKYLTGKNFDEVVMDKSKNVLVEFHAPWCGHCKKLAPVWDKLAETLEAEKKEDVVVAKMDATINELPHSRVRSFPTIRLYKKGDDKEQVEYNGERTLEGIKKFLETDGEYGKAAPDHDEL
eukprot:12966.XXX_358204_361378_1 [CDS] Oithona nana genome sequencing.